VVGRRGLSQLIHEGRYKLRNGTAANAYLTLRLIGSAIKYTNFSCPYGSHFLISENTKRNFMVSRTLSIGSYKWQRQFIVENGQF